MRTVTPIFTEKTPTISPSVHNRFGRLTGALLCASVLLVGCGDSAAQKPVKQHAKVTSTAAEGTPEATTASPAEVVPDYQVKAEAVAQDYATTVFDLYTSLESKKEAGMSQSDFETDKTVENGHVILTVTCTNHGCSDVENNGGEIRELTIAGNQEGSALVYEHVSVRIYNSADSFEKQDTVSFGSKTDSGSGYFALGSPGGEEGFKFISAFPEDQQDELATEELHWMNVIIDGVAEHAKN